MNNNIQSLGGTTSARLQREKALMEYYKSPNNCKNCNRIIHVGNGKVTDVKKRKFCSHSCAASFNNTKKIKKIIISKSIITREDKLLNITKGELFGKCKNYFSARSTITKIARLNMKKSNRDRICVNCGYNKHVEVCHIKGVQDFPDNSSLHEINKIENLMYLCPNCHWEFDNGLLSISSIQNKFGQVITLS